MRQSAQMTDLETPGVDLLTRGMLLPVYALVRASDVGCGAGSAIAELIAGVLLGAFSFNVTAIPIARPLSIFRIRRAPPPGLNDVWWR